MYHHNKSFLDFGLLKIFFKKSIQIRDHGKHLIMTIQILLMEKLLQLYYSKPYQHWQQYCNTTTALSISSSLVAVIRVLFIWINLFYLRILISSHLSHMQQQCKQQRPCCFWITAAVSVLLVAAVIVLFQYYWCSRSRIDFSSSSSVSSSIALLISVLLVVVTIPFLVFSLLVFQQRCFSSIIISILVVVVVIASF